MTLEKYRQSMDNEVLHSWAKEADRQIERMAISSKNIVSEYEDIIKSYDVQIVNLKEIRDYYAHASADTFHRALTEKISKLLTEQKIYIKINDEIKSLILQDYSL